MASAKWINTSWELMFFAAVGLFATVIEPTDVSTTSGYGYNAGSNSPNTTINETRTTQLNDLLNGYDARLPPNFNDDVPTNVTIDMLIQSFDSVSETRMEYSMTLVTQLMWMDNRLVYGSNIKPPVIELGYRMLEKIWQPDLVFTNEREGKKHEINLPNQSLRLYRNGTLFLKERFSLVLTCHMELEFFPLDTQTCFMEIESFAYTTRELALKWRDNTNVRMADRVELPRFHMQNRTIKVCDPRKDQLEKEQNSCLRVEFTLKRFTVYYILETYIPCFFIVMLSWLAFWIHAESAPARVTLGVTTVLTMITQSWVSRANLPMVSYVKAMDVWIGMCLVFVFCAMLEYAVVCVLYRREQEELKMHQVIDKFRNKKIEECCKCSITNSINSESLPETRKKFRIKSNMVDVISRVLFPLMFLLFNLGYWLYYARRE